MLYAGYTDNENELLAGAEFGGDAVPDPCFMFKGAGCGRGDKVGDPLNSRPFLHFVPELEVLASLLVPVTA